MVLQTHHPEYALRQVFTHTVPDQPLDDRRGETLLVNRVHEPRIKAGPRPEFVSDARDSIRRHYPDAASAKEAVARIALQQERQVSHSRSPLAPFSRTKDHSIACRVRLLARYKSKDCIRPKRCGKSSLFERK